jgi:hypothetical protein
MSIKTSESKYNLINNRIKYGTNNSVIVDTDTLIVDASTNRVGINTSTPQATLDVSGSLNIDTSNIINSMSGYRINTPTDTQIFTNVNNNVQWSYNQEIFDGANMFPNIGVSNSFLSSTYVAPNQGWFGSCLGPNGNIYTTPYFQSSTIIINTITDTWQIQNIPTTLSTRSFCIGGVCASNGKIYMFPIGAGGVLVNDIPNNRFYNINISFDTGLIGGYTGCCLGQNGKIYAIPRGANNVLVVNPVDDSYYFITSPDVSSGTDRKWFSGSLALNGKIYCPPARATSILVIDTNTDTMTASIPTLSGIPTNGTADEGKYWGSCLAPNGKIYCSPQNSSGPDAGSRFLEIDPITDTYVYVGASFSGTRKYAGGTLGFDGNIYCGSDNFGNAIRFNPNNYSTTTLSTSTRLWSGSLAPNGKIYFYPRQGSGTPSNQLNAVRIIDTGIPVLQPWMLAPEFNKL